MALEQDIQELTKAIRDFIRIAEREQKDLVATTAEEVSESVKALPTKAKKEEQKAEEAKEMKGVDYNDVKKAVLEVAKTKGREASIALLAPFGVVKGEGKERVGSITLLKPEQWEAVIRAATEMLGG